MEQTLRNLHLLTFEETVSMLLSFFDQIDESAVNAILVEHPQICTFLNNFVQDTLAEPSPVIQEWDQSPIGTRRFAELCRRLLLTRSLAIEVTPPEPSEASNSQDDAEPSMSVNK